MKKRLIPLIIAASTGIALTTISGCTKKSEEEKNAENEIRKLLQYDANININKNFVENLGFELYTEVKGNEYLLSFKTRKSVVAGRGVAWIDCDIITYSVDKDFYYDFCENYSTTETQKEVDMVTELTFTYDPIKIIADGKAIEIGQTIER